MSTSQVLTKQYFELFQKATVLAVAAGAQSYRGEFLHKQSATQTSYARHSLMYEHQEYHIKTSTTTKTMHLVAGVVWVSCLEGVVRDHGNYLFHCAKSNKNQPQNRKNFGA